MTCRQGGNRERESIYNKLPCFVSELPEDFSNVGSSKVVFYNKLPCFVSELPEDFSNVGFSKGSILQ